jgi:hypothetical protein
MILLPLALLIGSELGNWNADAAKAKVEFSIKGYRWQTRRVGGR